MQSAQGPEPPTSATQQVWAVPKLVGMILSHLEPMEIMVCKRINRFTRNAIDGNVDKDVGRKIWTHPTGTQPKVWLFGHTTPRITGVTSKAKPATTSPGRQESRHYTPVVPNPLLVKTNADVRLAKMREIHLEPGRNGRKARRTPDWVVLEDWVSCFQPPYLARNGSTPPPVANPHSASTLQDPLWLEGKSSTANMQLFDPPIYGEMKATCRSSEGRVMIYVIPTPGSDTSITWGAVGKAYKRVIYQYTKRQFKKHGFVYNHAETKTPIALEIRVAGPYVLVPQDMYWFCQQLLEEDYDFDYWRAGMNKEGETFEIADAGYGVPCTVPRGLFK